MVGVARTRTRKSQAQGSVPEGDGGGGQQDGGRAPTDGGAPSPLLLISLSHFTVV